jgi:mRNA interferase RelE/StbE
MPSKSPASTGASKYALAFERAALAEWEALDGSVKEPLRKALKARLETPCVPNSALRGDLANCYKIKLRKQGYRLIYRVIDDKLIVLVISVGKRDGDAVYKAAITRLREAASQKAARS